MKQLTEVLRLRDADIVWRSVEDEIVILHRADWQYLTVNETGGLLWMRIVDGATRTELVSLLVSEYGIEEPRARADVDAFVELLSECDLLAFGEGNGE
jgi:hypothetical protein